MKDIVRTGIIQQHNTSDIADNRRRIAEKIRHLASRGAELIVNQELHDSLYFCQTESVDGCDHAVEIGSEATKMYSDLAREYGVVIVTSIFERRAPGLYHNTAIVYDKDGIYPTIRHTTRSFTLRPATWDSDLSRRRSAGSGCLYAGTSGIPKLQG